MYKCCVVRGLLLPSRFEAAEPVRPRVRRLDHPAIQIPFRRRTAAAITASFAPNMGNIAAHLETRARLGLIVSLVRMEVLAATSRRAGSWKNDRINRFESKLTVVDVSASQLESDGDATTINDDGALGAEFAAVGWARAGFFPRQEAPSHWQCQWTGVPI